MAMRLDILKSLRYMAWQRCEDEKSRMLTEYVEKVYSS
jgi:hypothetical protein